MNGHTKCLHMCLEIASSGGVIDCRDACGRLVLFSLSGNIVLCMTSVHVVPKHNGYHCFSVVMFVSIS